MTFRTLLLVLVAAGTLAVAGCGEDDDAGTGDARAAGNGTDRAFVAEMVPHHESAVEMAQIAQDRGRSAFVKELAEDIIRTQTAEITTLRKEDAGLQGAGVEVGSLGVPQHMMGMDHDPADLKTAKAFDAEFLGMMIPHHEGALEMSKAELAKGEDPELRALARSIITGQRREIAAMRTQLGTRAPADGDHGADPE